MGYTLWDVVHKDIEKFRTVESNALSQELDFSNLRCGYSVTYTIYQGKS